LDRARQIKADLTLVYKSGQPVQVPVGSRAVRQAIEEFQPLISLHGHIHRVPRRGPDRTHARAQSRLGVQRRPDHGVVIKREADEVVSHQFTIG
jgi:uncharacterized protein